MAPMNFFDISSHNTTPMSTLGYKLEIAVTLTSKNVHLSVAHSDVIAN